MLFAKVKLRLKKYGQRTAERKRFQVNLLRGEGDKKLEFKLELRNRFKLLGEMEEETSIEEHWTKVKDVFKTTCKEVLGEKKREQKEWISKASVDKIDKRIKKKAQVNESRTRKAKIEADMEYREAAKEARNSVRKDKEDYVKQMAEKAERAATVGNMRILYQTTKTLTGKFGKPEVPVKDKEGNTVFGKEAQAKRWKEHFENLLNRPPPSQPPDILPARNNLHINCDPPSKEEITSAIKRLNIGKAPGPDEIPPEALRADAENTAGALQPLFKKIWEN